MRLGAFLLVAAMLAGCGKGAAATPEETMSGSREVVLYFADADGEYLAGETRWVEGDDVAVDVVDALIEGPSDDTHSITIPSGTRLLGLEVSEGVACVDLSREFREEHWGGSSEVLTIYSVVNTLTELEGIRAVQFLLEGEQVDTLTGHMDISRPLERDDSLLEPGMREVTLYFPNSTSERLGAEIRNLVGSRILDRMVDLLCEGPATPGLEPAFPWGTRRLAPVRVEQGVALVDLSREFLEQSSGSAGETVSVYALVNTLTGLEGIGGVQILVEGQTVENLGHMYLAEPITREESLLR